jgi:uncharacterized protein
MTALVPQSRRLSHSTPSTVTRPFWDGCGRGELLFQRCVACDEPNFEPTEWCRFCLADDLRWEPSCGRGVITTWTLVWHPVVPTCVVPYAPAVVELDEGFQILTNIVGCDHTEVCSGLRVRVSFNIDGEGFVLPYFRLERPNKEL